MQRHQEAGLARDLGVEPVIDLKGSLRMHGGRVIGLFVGPADLVEVLKSPEFRAWEQTATVDETRPGSFVGFIHGIAIYVLEEDLP